jgi:hypothetical protein
MTLLINDLEKNVDLSVSEMTEVNGGLAFAEAFAEARGGYGSYAGTQTVAINDWFGSYAGSASIAVAV